MAIGEAGTLRSGSSGRDDTIRVDFTEPMPDAIIHITASNTGGNEFSLRVVSVDEKGFEFQLEEFENHDGPHTTETFNWIAVKPGVHTLPDGRIIEAGTTNASTEASKVALKGTFEKPPVVLTNVMSENEKDVVDSDPFDISAKGFAVRLQEGSHTDGINAGESVGYIAISQGGDGSAGTAQVEDGLSTGFKAFALGADTEGRVVFAETQTVNEADAGNVHLDAKGIDDPGSVRLKFDEETGDGSGAHADETVGIVAFSDGIIPCFTPGALIETATGAQPVEVLRPGMLLRTRDAGFQPLRWVARVSIDADHLAMRPALGPVRIRANAIAPGQPARDLIVSPHHRVLITGYRAQLMFGTPEVLAPAVGLINGTTITRMGRAPVTYIHLLCDQHQILRSEGLWSESLLARELALVHSAPRDRAALCTVFPDLATLGRAEAQAARRCLTHAEARGMGAA